MRHNAVPIFWAAFGAAVASTAVELPLWWLAGGDVIRNLIRDAHLTAAIVLGRRVLAPPAGFDSLVMGVATVVHFSLSLAYAAVLAKVVRSMSFRSALAPGARLDSSCMASTCTHSLRSSRGSLRLAA